MRSWKTTLGGILSIGTSVLGIVQHLIDGSPVDYEVHISMIMAGIGLIFAKDFNVTGGNK